MPADDEAPDHFDRAAIVRRFAAALAIPAVLLLLLGGVGAAAITVMQGGAVCVAPPGLHGPGRYASTIVEEHLGLPRGSTTATGGAFETTSIEGYWVEGEEIEPVHVELRDERSGNDLELSGGSLAYELRGGLDGSGRIGRCSLEVTGPAE
ncbi:hypothetical protein HKCCE3408_09025 [Rhodobacterales bacterium HKCCE3408]|nr:hypothetical protein [Rhodobacterales bacterium HKCCE3408]